jgi:hypothetical protein
MRAWLRNRLLDPPNPESRRRLARIWTMAIFALAVLVLAPALALFLGVLVGLFGVGMELVT